MFICFITLFLLIFNAFPYLKSNVLKNSASFLKLQITKSNIIPIIENNSINMILGIFKIKN